MQPPSYHHRQSLRRVPFARQSTTMGNTSRYRKYQDVLESYATHWASAHQRLADLARRGRPAADAIGVGIDIWRRRIALILQIGGDDEMEPDEVSSMHDALRRTDVALRCLEQRQ